MQTEDCRKRRNGKKKGSEEKKISKDMVDGDLIVKLIKERRSKKSAMRRNKGI
jgi:hypothetical protein